MNQIAQQHGVPIDDDTVFCENNWNTRTPPAFYSAYRETFLVVILFDEAYQRSEGAYPEWAIIQDMKLHLHGRVLPVKFDSVQDAPLRNNHFCGAIDLSSFPDEESQAKEICKKLLKTWEARISTWRTPQEYSVICFEGEDPPSYGEHIAACRLPRLNNENREPIFGTIEGRSFYRTQPLRATCIYAPQECGREWELFEHVLARFEKVHTARRRSSVRMPVFVPRTVDLVGRRSLEELICRVAGMAATNSWEKQYRRNDEFEVWLGELGNRAVVNLLTSSSFAFADAEKLASEHCDPNAILNVLRWGSGVLYEKGRPFDLQLGVLHQSRASNNLIPLSASLAQDIRHWRSEMAEEASSTRAFRDVIFEALCDDGWRPIITEALVARSDRMELSTLYLEAPPFVQQMIHR